MFRKQEVAQMVTGKSRFIALRSHDELTANAASIVEQRVKLTSEAFNLLRHARRVGQQRQISPDHVHPGPWRRSRSDVCFRSQGTLAVAPVCNDVPSLGRK